MKSVFISRKSWQVSMATCLLAFTGIMSSELQAQVKIGFEATKLKTSPSAIILQLSNDTSDKANNKAAKALILPNVKATQQKATNSSMHQGLLHFNVDSNMFAFSRNKTAPQTQGGQSTNSGAEWKFLRYDSTSSGTVRFLKVEKEDLSNNNLPKEDGSCYTLTVEKKAIGNTLFIPYQRKENNNSQMHHLDGVQSQQQQQNQVKLMPRTRISYNGYALSPNKDYKIEIEPDNASQTQASQTQTATRDLAHLKNLAKQKVKITFLTLVPEKWEEFDEFFIEYEVI